MKMKKLNKKGFTLIELLAVIVILAIIVVVTVPSIISSINNARLSSLHSLAKEVASWYDTSLAQDELGLGSNILHGIKVLEAETIEDWHCLKVVMATENNYTDKSLADLYGLSENDISLNGMLPDDTYPTVEGLAEGTMSYGYCSAIRIINNKAEVVLIAKDGGKFDTNKQKPAYAYSFGKQGYDTTYTYTS